MDDTNDNDQGIVSRAKALVEGSEDWLDELEELGEDISTLFRADTEDLDVRSACEELLARERLPSLYRAQFLVYMACSEEDGDNTKMLERIEDAQYWIDDIDYVMRERGLQDSRVDKLMDGIAKMRTQITGWIAETAKPDPYASVPRSTGPPLLMSAKDVRPETYGPPMSTEEKRKMIQDAKDFERAVEVQSKNNEMQEQKQPSVPSDFSYRVELSEPGAKEPSQDVAMLQEQAKQTDEAIRIPESSLRPEASQRGNPQKSTLSVRTRPQPAGAGLDPWGRPAPSTQKYVPPTLRKAKVSSYCLLIHQFLLRRRLTPGRASFAEDEVDEEGTWAPKDWQLQEQTAAFAPRDGHRVYS
ncbi:hypothetical protein LTR37_001116 [Vermiconidia calcicola]|uniref:Uncharacterized protein n=1 Tax=Vermiconidia calcicola TaxID=1690605 RepID=A0ACC3NYK8_9PEZI|nr:hypothetical protein LTR37_001116 [Vermiconidia calcicola]